MFVIDEMRINRFQPRPVVSNRAMFQSLGERPATTQSSCTVDCYDSPSIDGASKTKLLGLASEIVKSKQEKEATNGESSSLNKDKFNL